MVIRFLHPTAAAHLIIDPILPGSLTLSHIIVNGICWYELESGMLPTSTMPFEENNKIMNDFQD